MLFTLAMDVLSSLIDKAEQLGLLAPLAARNIGHRMSLYANDVVLFTTPSTEDLTVIRMILQKTGQASGLHTNLAKSAILPIRCDEHRVQLLQQSMECTVAEFPCKYLGLPLSIRRLSKADLQPYIDKVADMLPSWKAALMAMSGRLILVRAVLVVILIHLLIALDLLKGFIKAIGKWRRSFLWRGHKELRGGHCPVSWSRVTRPLHFGRLGVLNLEIMAAALHMRWMWLRKIDPDKPWLTFDMHFSETIEATFHISSANNRSR